METPSSSRLKSNFFRFFDKHKIITIIIALVLAGGGYYFYWQKTNTNTVTRYVLTKVERGMISTSISGSGQISSSNQVEVKPKVSGDVVSLNVKIGQEVKAGDILSQLNTKDAQKTIRDAQINLQSAQLSLTKLKRGSLPEEIISGTNKVETAKKNIVDAQTNITDTQNKAEVDLANAYEDAQNVVSDSYSKVDDLLNRQLDKVFSGINTANPKLTFLTSNSAMASDATWQFYVAHNDVLSQLKNLSLTSDSNQAAVDQALIRNKEQLIIIQDFLTKLNGAINAAIISSDFSQSDLDSFKSLTNSARNTITTQINSLTSQQQALVNLKLTNKNSITAAQTKLTSAQDNLKQAEDDLVSIQAGSDPLDVRAQEISVQQRQNTLSDAREKLADYTIRVPFDGVVATVGTVVKGDSVSSADIIATVVTKQRLAEISLNEVDAAKAKIGQKATLTFDALENLSLTGLVAEIDSIGTVSQGVVTYQVKIVFDTQDESVKPGMSVSATIITDVKSDVLLVSNAALKSQNNLYYIEMPNEILNDADIASAGSTTGIELNGGVKQQPVEVGLASDTMTEVTSGLKEGDLIVSKIITGATTAAAAASTQKSLFQMGGGGPRN